MGTNVAVVPPTKMQTLRDLLEQPQVRTGLKNVLPKHLTPERCVRIALAAASRSPLLLECTPQSILGAVMQGAQLGLEAGSAIGLGYLVPYRNKKKNRMEAQFIPGYRGLIDLARRSGQVVSIEAHVIHKADSYLIDFGAAQPVQHRPNLEAEDPGPMVAVWARAQLVGGGHQIEVMTKAQVEAIRKRSRAGDEGPWQTDYEEMARKTVVRRLAKYLPLSVEHQGRQLQQALALEDRLEAGEDASDLIEGADLAGVLPDTTGDDAAGPVQLADQKASQLAQRLAKATHPAPPAKEAPKAPAEEQAGEDEEPEESEPGEAEGFGPDDALAELVEGVRGAASPQAVQDYVAATTSQVRALPEDMQQLFAHEVGARLKELAAKKPKGKKAQGTLPTGDGEEV